MVNMSFLDHRYTISAFAIHSCTAKRQRWRNIPRSELGGPSGKLFRFVSCVRARGAYVRSDLGENPCVGTFPFPFSGGRFSLFPLPSKVLSSFSWLYWYVLCHYVSCHAMSKPTVPTHVSVPWRPPWSVSILLCHKPMTHERCRF